MMTMRQKNGFSPRPATAPPPLSGLLQRKCACGGTPGPTGECSECRRKRLLSQRNPLAASSNAEMKEARGIAPQGTSPRLAPGHSFASVRVASPDLQPTFQRDLTAGNDADRFSEDGVLMTLAGSGTCQNGGGASVCDVATGTYKITSNNNTCCTKDCTQAHEQTHVNDVTRWGCCKALADAVKKPGADRNALVTKYNEWMAKASPLTECNAYSNDVRCANKMATDNGCDTDAGKNTDCCKDIADYKERYAEQQRINCAAAPNAAPPCPAF